MSVFENTEFCANGDGLVKTTISDEFSKELTVTDTSSVVQKDEEHENNLNYRLAVSHEEMNPRRRNTMEDCHRIHSQLYDLADYSYFGIYDGHGGRQIVDFLEESLEKNIVKELKLKDQAQMEERLARAFLITDMQSRQMNLTTSGATAVVALLHVDRQIDNSKKRVLYVANVGDSRAVLVSSDEEKSNDKEMNYIATRLSFDHRAEDAIEQQRITEAGGFIARNRVLGILAVTRSFGDHGMKDFIIASPFVSEVNLQNCGDVPALILACDGVWDVMTDQEAADLIINEYRVKGPFTEAANLLVTTAIEKGSADNVTAIVVFL